VHPESPNGEQERSTPEGLLASAAWEKWKAAFAPESQNGIEF
jgi:hypothetical protein